MTKRRCVPVAILAAVLPLTTLPAQGWRVAASGRATTAVTLNPPRDQQAAKPATISIEYGQPHARGRAVAGALPGDIGQVWRLGANEATTLRTEVDLQIGTLTVPKGAYTLAAETSTGEWKLIVNRKTGQWGIPYDASTELGRTPLASHVRGTPLETFTMWMVPADDGSPAGLIRFAWGTREFSVPWRAR